MKPQKFSPMQGLRVELGELLVQELHRPRSPSLRDRIFPLQTTVDRVGASTTMANAKQFDRKNWVARASVRGRTTDKRYYTNIVSTTQHAMVLGMMMMVSEQFSTLLLK